MLNFFRRAPPPCVFCDIVASLPADPTPSSPSSPPPTPLATVLRETPNVIAIKDKFPASKHHYLVMPKEHIANAKCLTLDHATLWQEMTQVGKELALNIEDETER